MTIKEILRKLRLLKCLKKARGTKEPNPPAFLINQGGRTYSVDENLEVDHEKLAISANQLDESLQLQKSCEVVGRGFAALSRPVPSPKTGESSAEYSRRLMAYAGENCRLIGSDEKMSDVSMLNIHPAKGRTYKKVVTGELVKTSQFIYDKRGFFVPPVFGDNPKIYQGYGTSWCFQKNHLENDIPLVMRLNEWFVVSELFEDILCDCSYQKRYEVHDD